jgi:dihydropyrimidinase
MKYDLVIQGGTLVGLAEPGQADLAVQDGRIAAIGRDLSGKEILDASGMYLLPGGVDPHVHLDMPAAKTTSADDWKTGTRAAVCGGTTTVIDFIEPEVGQTLEDAWIQRMTEAEKDSLVDFGLHMTIDPDHLDCLGEIPRLVDQGLPSFKLYTTYAGFKLEDHQMLQVMDAVSQAGGMVLVHCESDAMVSFATRKVVEAGRLEPASHPISRPPEAELEAVQRVLALAGLANVPVYIVHISTRGGAEALARATSSGQLAWGETCPQYLVLDESGYQAPDFQGAKFVCSPPLRGKSHQKALWHGLASQTLHAIGTDHCPFNFQGQKDLGRADFRDIPGGLPGIQSRLELLYTFGVKSGTLSLEQWVNICCTTPATIFGLGHRKGSIRVGADADLVLFDPQQSKTIQQSLLVENVDYSPYEGLELLGSVVATVVGGQLVAQEGKVLSEPRGTFQPRRNFKEVV